MGVVRIQTAERMGVVQPVLRAIEPVKGNAKGNPKDNVEGKGCAHGTGQLCGDGSSTGWTSDANCTSNSSKVPPTNCDRMA